jgi:sodium transport system permease protein
MELLVAKGALVLLSGLLTSGLNMISMSLVIWRSLSLFEGPMGALTINMKALGLTYLAAVPTLITFTTLVLIVGLLARTFREANHFATPIMMIPLASMLIGIAEPDMTPALLVTPVANTTLIIREVMVGRVTPGAFVLAFISSMVYAGLFLSMAARLFTNEQLVNPAWEPLTFKGLKAVSGAGRKKQFRLPSVDEALALFSVTLLLSFYVGPSLAKFGFTKMLLIQEIVLLAGPAVLWAWVAKFKWVETFSWRKPTTIPTPVAMIAAILLGVGLSPWMQLLQMGQEKIWPPDHEYQMSMLQLLLPSIERFPILMPMLIGILAGTCEELLFRGPIQKGLLRRLPIWPAIVITAILFAAAHLDLYGLPIRTLLGVILGWLVIRTGSIFPAMATHAAFDITQLLHLSYAVHRVGAKNLESSEGGMNPWLLAGGAAMIALAGFVLASPKSSSDLPLSVQSEC